MPSHPERVRTASLTTGYQFGDAGRAAVRHDALEDDWYADLKPVQFTAEQEAAVAAWWRLAGRLNASQHLYFAELQDPTRWDTFTTNRDLGDER